MFKTKKLACENPDAVRQFARKCNDPLRSRLLSIVEEVADD